MNIKLKLPKTWLPAFEPQVEHDLFLLSHRNLSTTGWGQMLLASLVAVTCYGRSNTTRLAIWWGLLTLLGLGYAFLHRRFATEVTLAPPNESGVRRWKRARRTLQFLSAVGWGAMAWLMVPGDAVLNAVLMIVFAGVVGHAAAGNSANDFWAVVVSAITIWLIFIQHIPDVFGNDAGMLVLMLTLYIVVLISSLGNTHRTLRQSIGLKIENKALAVSNAEQAARAEKANRDKSEFLAAASHDLRQPVHALLLLLEAYRQQVPAASDHPLMQHIVAAGQSINSLFNALMELSRLESGTEKITVSQFGLSAALQDVLTGMQPEAQAKGLSLRCYQSPDMRQIQVCTDQVLLKRIVGNLISNAVRYTPRGGVLLTLRRAYGPADQGGQNVWIEVWDTGVGIAQEDQARIFDPYVQMGNPERDRSQGLGLGLAIVRRACDLLGFKVALTSVPHRGTRMRLILPDGVIQKRPRQEPVLAASSHGASPRATAGVWLRARRVLLVDDDPLVQLAMQALLKQWQLDVRVATRGDASVLQSCEAGWEPECILCDFRLPGTMNGIELLDFLQQQFPAAIGLLLTGETLPSVQDAAEDAGYMLLSKPVDPELLAYTLGVLLERRHEERSA